MNKEKILKLLKLTQSSNDNEALSAIRMVNKNIESWEGLFSFKSADNSQLIKQLKHKAHYAEIEAMIYKDFYNKSKRDIEQLVAEIDELKAKTKYINDLEVYDNSVNAWNSLPFWKKWFKNPPKMPNFVYKKPYRSLYNQFHNWGL